MPEGYDGVKTKKQQGSPVLQGVGGVHLLSWAFGASAVLFD